MEQQKDINERMSKLLKWKMRFLFKSLLTVLEEETLSFNINKEFFDKGIKNKGIGKIRKTLFDNGNSIIELMDLIFSKIEISPSNTVIEIDDKLLKEIESDRL